MDDKERDEQMRLLIFEIGRLATNISRLIANFNDWRMCRGETIAQQRQRDRMEGRDG